MSIRANQIKLKEHLGIVTSDASTLRFNFFVTPLKGKLSVEERNYVLVSHPTLGDSHPILAQVVEIKNYEEVVGTTLNEKAVHTTAAGEILGYVESKGEKRTLKRLFSPPTPGSKVYIPFREFIEDLFQRNSKGKPFKSSLFLGTLESMANTKRGKIKPVRFYLDGKVFANQHVLISSMTGAGKTYTTTVLVEELANKHNLPIVIFDSNSEYLQVGIAGDQLGKLLAKKKIESDDYLFNFKVSVFTDDVHKISRIYEKQTKKILSVNSLSIFQSKNNRENDVNFSDKLRKNMKSAKVTIIDTKSLDFDERQKLFSLCLKNLLKNRIKGAIEPFILIIEDGNSLDSKTLENLYARSRKIGISTMLLTQHPSELENRILSQMGTQIMGRTVNQQDLLCLANMALDKTDMLPKLKKGEWIINGISLQGPRKVLVREKFSKITPKN